MWTVKGLLFTYCIVYSHWSYDKTCGLLAVLCPMPHFGISKCYASFRHSDLVTYISHSMALDGRQHVYNG